VRYMFRDAGAFDQDLCAWGTTFQKDTNVLGGMFSGTACDSTSNPVWIDNYPPGPFCHECTPPSPTPRPTEKPTPEPTLQPTNKPTPEPSHEPADTPTPVPTHGPTDKPTLQPTNKPTLQPTTTAPISTAPTTIAPTTSVPAVILKSPSKPGSKEKEENYICEPKELKDGEIQHNTHCKKSGKKADASLSGAKHKMRKSHFNSE
jgi:hypothetical protein